MDETAMATLSGMADSGVTCWRVSNQPVGGPGVTHMPRLILLTIVAATFAACSSSSPKQAQRSQEGSPTTTVEVAPSGADQGTPTTSTTTAPSGGGTTTTAAAARVTTTTARKAATAAQQAAADPATTTTTTGAPGTTTTIPATTTTTGQSTTTRALETVPALTIGRPAGTNPACNPQFQKGIPEGMDFDRLAADLAARGYRMGTVKFRTATGSAIADPPERSVDDTRAQWKQCFDGQGGKKGIPVLTTGGTAGAHAFADLVVGQLDEVFAGYGSWYAGVTVE